MKSLVSFDTFETALFSIVFIVLLSIHSVISLLLKTMVDLELFIPKGLIYLVPDM